MNYYIRESEESIGDTMPQAQRMTASVKPRADVDRICAEVIQNAIDCPLPKERKNYLGWVKDCIANLKEWKKRLSPLKKGDVVLFQYPLLDVNLFQNKIFRFLKRRKVRIILLVHDMDWLRTENKKLKTVLHLKILKKALSYANVLILHNKAMESTVSRLKAKKICLGLFDYLMDEVHFPQRSATLPVAIAGSLRREKAGYAYNLPGGAEWNLYGPYYTAQADNVHYKGSFASDRLPYELDGSFGLVWDGDSVETCSGSWGRYLRYNNPHKASLYLACGMPVIIWKEAALAEFIREHDCGLVVDSLAQIPQILKDLTQARYDELLKNAEETGKCLRSGYFTKQALTEALI